MGISAHSHFGYILRALIILTFTPLSVNSEYENYINEHEKVFFNTRKRSESACALSKQGQLKALNLAPMWQNVPNRRRKNQLNFTIFKKSRVTAY